MLEGDTGAASRIPAKDLLSLRSWAEKMWFDLDVAGSVASQVEQVLYATERGAVSPDVVRLIIDSMKSLADVRAIRNLQDRFAALGQRTSL